MIKKTRNQFVLMNVASITLILLIVFGALIISTYNKNNTDISSSLQETTNRAIAGAQLHDANPDNGDLPPTGSPNADSGLPPGGEIALPQNSNAPLSRLSSFVIIANSDGSYSDAISDYSELDLNYEDILLATQKQGNLSGKLDGYSYHYHVVQDNGLYFYAYVDTTIITSSFQRLLLTSLLLGLGGLILVFLASLYLSNWILKPVIQSWNQQKQFIADASHELKTPLTVIMANNQILKAHPDSTIREQQRWIDSTAQESLDMQQLIGDMLFLAKHDQAKQEEVKSTISISDILLNCALGFEPIAFQKNIILDTNIDPDIEINGNPAQLKQLFTIFIDNACKYSHPNTVIKISLKKTHPFTFKITNFGSYLTEDNIIHLFDRFYRTDSSRSREQGGAGLGLAIAKQISDLHQLNLTVTSSKDGGTTFALRPIKS